MSAQSPVGLRFVVPETTYITFGTFRARLYPPRTVEMGGWDEPDYDHRPWAWIGSTRLTFHCGRMRTSKIVRAKATSPRDVVTGDDRAEMFERMEADMVRLIKAHGIEFGYAIPWFIENAELPSGVQP